MIPGEHSMFYQLNAICQFVDVCVLLPDTYRFLSFTKIDLTSIASWKRYLLSWHTCWQHCKTLARVSYSTSILPISLHSNEDNRYVLWWVIALLLVLGKYNVTEHLNIDWENALNNASIIKGYIYFHEDEISRSRQVWSFKYSACSWYNALRGTLLPGAAGEPSQIARFTWPTWGQPGHCRPQVGPMSAPWTLPSGMQTE